MNKKKIVKNNSFVSEIKTLIEQSRRQVAVTVSTTMTMLYWQIGKRINKRDLVAKPALTIFEEDFRIKVSQAVQTVEATVADAEIAPLLGVRVGEPLLKVERIVFDKNKKPIEYVLVLYRSDKYCFTVTLERKRSKESIGWEPVQ